MSLPARGGETSSSPSAVTCTVPLRSGYSLRINWICSSGRALVLTRSSDRNVAAGARGRNIQFAIGGDLHRALEIGVLVADQLDLLQRPRVGADPQLQMASLEKAGRMAIGGVNVG